MTTKTLEEMVKLRNHHFANTMVVIDSGRELSISRLQNHKIDVKITDTRYLLTLTEASDFLFITK